MKIQEFLTAIAVVAGVVLSLAPMAARAEVADDEIVISQQDDETVLTLSDMESRGADGSDMLVSTQSLAANSTGNTVDVAGDMTTGAVNVADNFANGGLGSYVFNTGNNATINSAVSVNVQFSAAP